MTRDAKLYLLSENDWMPLAENIYNNSDYTLKNDVTIFQLPKASNKDHEYALLSLSDKADKIIEAYGATLASEPNMLRNSLHIYHGEPLFGDKTNLIFLNKIP